MWMRGRRKTTAKAEGMAYEQIREKLDAALTSVFSEEGKKAVLYHMTEKYSLTLEQASANPRKLDIATRNAKAAVHRRSSRKGSGVAARSRDKREAEHSRRAGVKDATRFAQPVRFHPFASIPPPRRGAVPAKLGGLPGLPPGPAIARLPDKGLPSGHRGPSAQAKRVSAGRFRGSPGSPRTAAANRAPGVFPSNPRLRLFPRSPSHGGRFHRKRQGPSDEISSDRQ